MNNFWLKLKIWTKLIVVVAVVIYITLFVVNNNGPQSQATIWLFFGSGSAVTTSVLQLVLGTFLLGVVVTILARTTFRTIGQIKELKARQATEKKEKEIEELKARAGMLRIKPATDDADKSVV